MRTILPIKRLSDIRRNATTIWDNRDELLSHTSPEVLMFLALQADVSRSLKSDAPDRANQLATLKFALESGANPNFNYYGVEPIELAMWDSESLELLFKHGARCDFWSYRRIKNAGLGEVFTDPYFLLNRSYQSLYTPSLLEPRIPPILHMVWVTSAQKPREIRQQDMKIILNNHALLQNSSMTWQMILWTNDPLLLPESVSQLERHGIEVRVLQKWELSNLETINNLIASEEWGKAGDRIRYAVLSLMGGVYVDLNLVLQRIFDEELHRYTFFAQKSFDYMSFSGAYIAATADHPILKLAMQLSEDVVTDHEFAKVYDQKSIPMTIFATVEPLVFAYYLDSNSNSSYADTLLPPPESSHLAYERFLVEWHPTVSHVLQDRCPELYLEAVAKVNSGSIGLCGSMDAVGHDSPDGGTWWRE